MYERAKSTKHQNWVKFPQGEGLCKHVLKDYLCYWLVCRTETCRERVVSILSISPLASFSPFLYIPRDVRISNTWISLIFQKSSTYLYDSVQDYNDMILSLCLLLYVSHLPNKQKTFPTLRRRQIFSQCVCACERERATHQDTLKITSTRAERTTVSD